MITISDSEFSLLKNYLHDACGIDVPPEKRYLFETRLADFLAGCGCRSFSDFYARLSAAADDVLRRQLIQAMTIHESSFFRDKHPFDCLMRKLLPVIASHRAAEAVYLPPRLRILSAGCSLGQEPYTIAMCVRQWLRMQERFSAQDVTVLGVDVSDRVLSRAQGARYSPPEVGNHIPPAFRSEYLMEEDGCWTVRDEIRGMVGFARFNLSEPLARLGRFDAIFCRNVIIYFSLPLKQRILEQFHQMLNPGGVLFLGVSESVYMISDLFVPIHDGSTTYYVPRVKAEAPEQ